MPELHPIVYEVLTYMDHQQSKDSRIGETTKYDSRFIFQGVKPHVHKTHNEWIAFLKEVQIFKLALKKIKMFPKFKFLFNDIEWDKYDLRATPFQEEFAMLPPMHVSLLLCFDAISIPESKESRESMYGVYHVLDELAESVRLLSHDVANELAKHKQSYLPVSLPIILAMLKGQNKTLEEVLEENVKAEKLRGKEEKLEKEFGAKLAAQGIPVQYQVRCEHGRADIVTPDAIYEIKASLSRSTLHKAIAQVLLYRDCINPSAKAVVVGYPHKKEKVDVAMANRLNVEVIVCEESV